MDDVAPSGGGDGGGPRGPRPTRPPGPGIQLPDRMTIATGCLGAAALGAVLVLGLSGNLGFVDVTDSEVAVKMNYLTGTKEVITTPGYKLYIPFAQGIFKLDRTPQSFLMEGTKSKSDNSAPLLTVRASDGSNFRFESLEIQYEILPEMADVIIEDSGVMDGFKRDWIRAYARSVLRDEFGRFSAVEVADPSSYTTARVRSTDRLNEYLAPHGIKIVQIITPKPRFDARYEEAIEERKVADQEVERLKQRELQLAQERERELAQVQKEKEIQWQELQGELKKIELEAQRQAIQITKEADRYKVTREAEGQQQLDRLTAEAEGLVAKYTKEAEGIRAKAEALEARGRVVVREALIEKLSRISFTLVPYSRDPMPKRLEHSDARGGVEELSGALQGGQQ